MGLVGCRNSGVELGERLFKSAGVGGGGGGAYRHQQRKKPAFVADWVNVQLQFSGIEFGPLLVRRQNAGLRAGNRHRRGQVGIVGMQHVKSAPRDPLRVGNAVVSFRPHPAQLRGKAKSEVGGMQAIKFEQHHRPRARPAPVGRKHDLAHGKCDVADR